jgi:hypothetical protein
MKMLATLAAAGLTAVSLVVPAFAEEGAKSIIDRQIKAFRSGNHTEAFSYAAPSLQRTFRNTDNFIGMVKRGYSPIYGAQDWSFGRSRTEGDTHYQELLLTGPKGRNWGALYIMRRDEDGTWRIHGVQLNRASAQTT